ncbi:SSUH2 -like protein [Brachionus plicatilis]|uniref:SSUH2-like protein n=1 Tax=Brachionus plicatilis TaxID=10195 RepID=A0A3M7PB15_BRAPC|nr:SSUH2 -like protein [Brachionus plicatilis]RMZ96224.1 SSUH2 -like protein [Brachionus plicatilis]
MYNVNYGYQDELVNDPPPAYPDNPSCPGYQIGFCPPEPINVKPEINSEPVAFKDASALSEQEAKEVLANYVSEKCCYGKGPVKNLEIIEMLTTNTFQYTLETFTENRATSYVYEPSSNQIIINNGMAPPHPWDIPVSPGQMFICKKCHGRGNYICNLCNGRGSKSCFHCNGSGRGGIDQKERCIHCSGSGNEACNSCSRTGYKICRTCAGSGRLRWYLQLIVEFKNNKDDFFSKTEFVPDKLLKKCVVETIFSDTNYRVFPVTNHPNQYINEASSNLLNQHLNKFSQSRILSQRHEIKSIPVTGVKHLYKTKMYNFVVFGLDNKLADAI